MLPPLAELQGGCRELLVAFPALELVVGSVSKLLQGPVAVQLEALRRAAVLSPPALAPSEGRKPLSDCNQQQNQQE